nr:polymerase [Carollia bat paramyxovirus]
MTSFKTSDILFPECHLDSPIVAGKLITLLYYSDLPHNQILEDSTLTTNLEKNSRENKRINKNLLNKQLEFKSFILEKYPDINKIDHIPYPHCNGRMFRWYDDELTSKLRRIIHYSHSCYNKISHKIVDLKHSVIMKLGGANKDNCNIDTEIDNHIRNLPKLFEGSPWYEPFFFWFTIKTEMRSLIKSSSNISLNDTKDVIVHDTSKSYIVINRNLTALIDKSEGKVFYFTFEMILMYSDVLEGRLMTDVGMKSDKRMGSITKKVYKLWDFFDALFEDLGNKNYDFVAYLEPLCLGHLQLKDSSQMLRGAFLDFCYNEIWTDLYENLHWEPEDIKVILSIISDIFDIHDIHLIAEMFSFFRSFGHPILEATNAANKVREHMNKPKIIKFETMMQGHALFCSMIINGYRERHSGIWPPCTPPDHFSRKLIELQQNNEAVSDEIAINNWKSFVGFRFKCFMPLNLDEDLTIYMKDKALAAIKKEWDSTYPYYIMPYNPSIQTTSRRLVEVFLDDESFDPYDIIWYVINGDYLVDDDFNLSYSLKEKEIKQVGRLFAKMTYKMRACQVVAESLIATGVGKYFKENGMVKNEHELLKTLHKLSSTAIPRDNKVNKESEFMKKKLDKQSNFVDKHSKIRKDLFSQDSNDHYEVVSTFLTTDLQKFCLNWRAETTNIFAERLNEIYGLPGFFNWLHKRLEISTLYVADPHCPPYNQNYLELDEVENRQIFIKYPMGGPEGYSQKLWTIITIPFLFLSAHQVGARIAAVVQGDNQAIAITRRVHPNLPLGVKKNLSAELAKRYFIRLRDNMGDIGHNLKANETIVSSHFFVYSKRIYYDGMVLSQALKPLSRAVFWSETIVDETRSACSNIATAISKSIEQGFDRWIGYSMYILKSLQQLVISIKFTINDNITDDIVNPLYSNQTWMIYCALIPAQLGGFNYMNISRLYLRNIGDPITASIADVKRMIHVGLLTEGILQKIMHQKTGDSTYLDWASDPYSINIPNSQSVTVMLKNITSRVILQNSSNPMLRGLFHTDFDNEDHDLAQFLMDRPIIIPRAAHEILDKSLTGARQEIAGMLDTTKGLIRNSIKLGGLRPRLLDRIALYDYEQFRVFNNLMQVKTSNPLITKDNCSVQLAITIRKRMWSELAYGRPIYGLEVPDTIEAVNGSYVQNCEDCYYCAAGNKEYGWFYVPSLCELDDIHKESNTLRVPYFGSTTEERSEIKLGDVKNTSRALKAAVRIATVYTWAYGDNEMNWIEAWYIASTRANVGLEELRAITPVSTSNNIAHRLRDKSTQMKYSGSSLNRVSRHTIISNDKLNFFKDGEKIDTNLVYQQIMLIGLSSLEDYYRYDSNTGIYNNVLHLHIESNCCVTEMSEHPFTETENILPVLQKVDCNRLIYDDNPIIEIEKIRLRAQSVKKDDVCFPKWSDKQLEDVLAKSLALTLVEIMTRENRDHVSDFKSIGNEDDINSLITEFLLVNPALLTLYLGQAIAINWAYDIYYRRPEGKYQMIEFLESILHTSSKSYLDVLSNVFSHPTVFDKFWNCGYIEPIHGPNIATQDFNKIAIDFVVHSYSNYLNFVLNGDNHSYLINESSDDIVDQKEEVVRSRYKAVLCCLYLDRSSMPILRGLTSIDKYNKMSEILQKQKLSNHNNLSWNLKDINTVVYPASLTYLRRGTIKYLRLRQRSSTQLKGFSNVSPEDSMPRLIPFQKQDIRGLDDGAVYFPATAVFSGDFLMMNKTNIQVPRNNRWESHVKRRVGINSTSCYKAIELSLYLKSKINCEGSRLFLGEGSGGMMTTYYFSLGKCINYFNTGVLNYEVIGQRVIDIRPSEVGLVSKNSPIDDDLNSSINILFNGKPESTWIGDISSFSYIMNTIDLHSLSLIHSDMESVTTKDSYTVLKEQIHALCLAINLGASTSYFVTKIAPIYNDYTYEIISILEDYYEEVFIFIPNSSNPYSSEIYLVSGFPKTQNLIYPDLILNKLPKDMSDRNHNIQDLIISLKIREHNLAKSENKQFDDYLQSNLTKPTKSEEYLISYGFQFNGPKIVNEVAGHDVGGGEQSLISSINTLTNNLANVLDETRNQIPFFDPYPVLKSSKVRESCYAITRKVAMFYILYGKNKHPNIRREFINSIRRRKLILDLNSNIIKVLLSKYLFKRIKQLKIKKVYQLDLTTSEVKKWWKAVGYSLLI